MKLILVLQVLALTVFASVTGDELQNTQHTPTFPMGRITNGHEAKRGEAPFIVSLKIFDIHFCAGAIIDPHWVLTAAHCLIFDSFDVFGGLHSHSDESDVQIRTVDCKNQQISHERYNNDVGPYDIGLIYIAEPFNLTAQTRDGVTAVGKISLPSGRYAQTGRGRLLGWGLVNSDVYPDTLQALDVDIINYSKCKASMPAGSQIDPLNLCSYTAGKTDGSCDGDSGGPLVRFTKSGTQLVGIVSWGFAPYDTSQFPSIYTRTSAYKQWIKKKIQSYRHSECVPEGEE